MKSEQFSPKTERTNPSTELKHSTDTTPLPRAPINREEQISKALQELTAAKILPNDSNQQLILSKILAKRETSLRPEDLAAFLKPDLDKELADPTKMKNFQVAAEAIIRAVKEGRRIAICCDYDVDGLTSGAQLKRVLDLAGAQNKVFVSNRFKGGYGLTNSMVEQAATEGFELLVALDFGTGNIAELNLARSMKLETCVFDHHNPSKEPCPADYLVNPKQNGCGYAGETLCTSGITWLLTRYITEKLELSPEVVNQNLALSALGTICDLVPLKSANRAIASLGLDQFSKSELPGVRAIRDVFQLGENITAKDIQFFVGPSINAAGRLQDATLVVELFSTTDNLKAGKLAKELKSLNDSRKQIQESITSICKERISALEKVPSVIVLSDSTFHPGVIGAVAQRLVETYERPVFLMGGGSADTFSGSARGPSGFNVIKALSQCEKLLIKFGGHNEAAGFSVRRSNVNEFKSALESHATNLELPSKKISRIVPDIELYLSDINFDTMEALKALEPCGMGNERARVGIKGLRVEKLKPNRGGSFSVLFSDGSQEIKAFCRPPLPSDLVVGSVVDIVGALEVSNWGGRRTIELSTPQVERSTVKLTHEKKELLNTFQANWDSEIITSQERLNEVVKTLLGRKIIGIDTETYGWDTDKQTLSLVQIGDPVESKVYVIDALSLENLEPLRPLLESPDIIKVEHFGSFENARFDDIGIHQANMKDTYLIAQELLPELPNRKLNTCVKYILGKNLSKAQQGSNWQKRPLDPEQLNYAADDPVVAFKLYERLEEIRAQAKTDLEPSLEGCMKQLWDAERSLDELLRSRAPFLYELRARKELLKDHIRTVLKTGVLEYNGPWGSVHRGSPQREIVINRFRDALRERVNGKIDSNKIEDLCESLYRISKKEFKKILTASGLTPNLLAEIEEYSYVNSPDRGSPKVESHFKSKELEPPVVDFTRLGIRELMHELSFTERMIYETYRMLDPDLFIASARASLIKRGIAARLSGNPKDSYRGKLGIASPGSFPKVFQLDRFKEALAKHLDSVQINKLLKTLPFLIYKGEAEEILTSEAFSDLGLSDPKAMKEFFWNVMSPSGEAWSASIVSSF